MCVYVCVYVCVCVCVVVCVYVSVVTLITLITLLTLIWKQKVVQKAIRRQKTAAEVLNGVRDGLPVLLVMNSTEDDRVLTLAQVLPKVKKNIKAVEDALKKTKKQHTPLEELEKLLHLAPGPFTRAINRFLRKIGTLSQLTIILLTPTSCAP